METVNRLVWNGGRLKPVTYEIPTSFFQKYAKKNPQVLRDLIAGITEEELRKSDEEIKAELKYYGLC